MFRRVFRQVRFTVLLAGVTGSAALGDHRHPRILFRRRSLVAVTAAIALLLLIQPCRADDSLKVRFLSEYPKALERLKEAYSHINGSGTETVEFNAPKRRWVSVKRWTFQIDGESMRLDEIQEESTKKPPEETGQQRVVAVNREYMFIADKASTAKSFALSKFRADGDYQRGYVMNFRYKYLITPFASRGWTIDTFLWDKGVSTIKSIESVVKDGRTLVKVTYDRMFKFGDNLQRTECWLLLDPDNGWILREQDSISFGRQDEHTLVEYGPPVHGIPTIKRIIRTSKYLKETFDLDAFNFGNSDSAVFRLASVGLPEMPAPSAFTTRRLAIWLFVLGNILAALAVILFAIRRRSRRPELSD